LVLVLLILLSPVSLGVTTFSKQILHYSHRKV